MIEKLYAESKRKQLEEELANQMKKVQSKAAEENPKKQDRIIKKKKLLIPKIMVENSNKEDPKIPLASPLNQEGLIHHKKS